MFQRVGRVLFNPPSCNRGGGLKRTRPTACETLLDTGRYQRSSGAAMPPGRWPHSGRGLILMGVWRDPRCGRSHQPKKRARYESSGWKRPMNDVGSSRCQQILLGILTTGRLVGVTVTPIRKGVHKSNCKVLADQAPNPCKLKRLPAREQTLAQSFRGLFTD